MLCWAPEQCCEAAEQHLPRLNTEYELEIGAGDSGVSLACGCSPNHLKAQNPQLSDSPLPGPRRSKGWSGSAELRGSKSLGKSLSSFVCEPSSGRMRTWDFRLLLGVDWAKHMILKPLNVGRPSQEYLSSLVPLSPSASFVFLPCSAQLTLRLRGAGRLARCRSLTSGARSLQ